MISLSLMIRLISAITVELTHTVERKRLDWTAGQRRNEALTLFSDQGIVAVVGVVRVTRSGAAAVAHSAKVKLCGVSGHLAKSSMQFEIHTKKLMAEAPRVTGAMILSVRGSAQGLGDREDALVANIELVVIGGHCCWKRVRVRAQAECDAGDGVAAERRRGWVGLSRRRGGR